MTRAPRFERLSASEFLFPGPSILYGFARLLDLGAQLDSFNEMPTPQQADFWAMYGDRYMVGKDFWSAVETYRRELEASRR